VKEKGSFVPEKKKKKGDEGLSEGKMFQLRGKGFGVGGPGEIHNKGEGGNGEEGESAGGGSSFERLREGGEKESEEEGGIVFAGGKEGEARKKGEVVLDLALGGGKEFVI